MKLDKKRLCAALLVSGAILFTGKELYESKIIEAAQTCKCSLEFTSDSLTYSITKSDFETVSYYYAETTALRYISPDKGGPKIIIHKLNSKPDTIAILQSFDVGFWKAIRDIENYEHCFYRSTDLAIPLQHGKSVKKKAWEKNDKMVISVDRLEANNDYRIRIHHNYNRLGKDNELIYKTYQEHSCLSSSP